jgi:signal peptidase I
VLTQVELANDSRDASVADILRDRVRQGEPVELTVRTGSMYPHIEPGDLVSLTPADDIRTGDIVVFPRDGMLYAHRVVGFLGHADGKKIITRGDRCPQPDPPVEYASLIGKVASVVRSSGPNDRSGRKYQIVARSLHLVGEFSRVRRMLEQAGIACIPLKGVSLYLQSLIDPGARSIGDIDVLVRLEDVSRALSVLAAHGYIPPRACMRPRYGIFLNSVPLVKSDVCLHLHWHLLNTTLPLFMYRIDMEHAWAASREREIEGEKVLFLSPEHEIIHLCLHAFNHSYEKPSLVSDCAAVCAWVDSRVCRDTLLTAARAWNCAFPVYCTLEVCSRLGRPTGTMSADFAPANARLQRAANDFLERVAARGRGYHNEVFPLELLLAGGVCNRLRFLFLTAFPYPEVMRCIYSSYAGAPLFSLYWRRMRGRISVSTVQGCRRIVRR